MPSGERVRAMSLVGSLEDLGLGDILQIVHLAGKSGVLRLRGEAGEGQIVFKNGMIREAYAKGGPTDLRELLALRRTLAGPLLERAWLEAHHAGRMLADVLVERGLVSAEAIDTLRHEQIESAVLAMFGWPSGEFSFEMREVGDAGAELALAPGVNPQFLALEGTRRADERVARAGCARGRRARFRRGAARGRAAPGGRQRRADREAKRRRGRCRSARAEGSAALQRAPRAARRRRPSS